MSATEVARSLHSSAPVQARAQAGRSIRTEEILIKHMSWKEIEAIKSIC